LVHIRDRAREQRSFHFLGLDSETFFVANWYWPPNASHDGLLNLAIELKAYFKQFYGIIVAGDPKIHHQKWLRFSDGNSQVGADLESVCEQYGLWQAVRQPTKQQYLLDRALFDIHGYCGSCRRPYSISVHINYEKQYSTGGLTSARGRLERTTKAIGSI
jgi:hypothetical protein